MALAARYYGDPALIAEQNELRSKRKDIAKERLLKQFQKGDEMGRKLEVPPQITAALFQWGDWSRRPNMWVNLGPTPMYKLLPIPQEMRPEPNPNCDQQSHHIHRAVMRLSDDDMRVALYLYYVLCIGFADLTERQQTALGFSKMTFYRKIKDGSLLAYNSGIRLMQQQKIVSNC